MLTLQQYRYLRSWCIVQCAKYSRGGIADKAMYRQALLELRQVGWHV